MAMMDDNSEEEKNEIPDRLYRVYSFLFLIRHSFIVKQIKEFFYWLILILRSCLFAWEAI